MKQTIFDGFNIAGSRKSSTREDNWDVIEGELGSVPCYIGVVVVVVVFLSIGLVFFHRIIFLAIPHRNVGLVISPWIVLGVRHDFSTFGARRDGARTRSTMGHRVLRFRVIQCRI